MPPDVVCGGEVCLAARKRVGPLHGTPLGRGLRARGLHGPGGPALALTPLQRRWKQCCSWHELKQFVHGLMHGQALRIFPRSFRLIIKPRTQMASLAVHCSTIVGRRPAADAVPARALRALNTFSKSPGLDATPQGSARLWGRPARPRVLLYKLPGDRNRSTSWTEIAAQRWLSICDQLPFSALPQVLFSF
jgi:hypothetical protein